MTETKWFTVAEATRLAHEMGLDRTLKTTRSWARNGHVTAQKQTNQNGSIWVIERESLITKIKSEIEFRDQDRDRASDTPRTKYEQVWTGTNASEPVRTGSDAFEPSSQHDENQTIQTLKDEINGLKIEVKFNEQMTQEFKKQYLKGQEAVQAQSRYIGHLETKILEAGSSADLAFLAAPVPNSGPSGERDDGVEVVSPEIIQNDQPHPNQRPFSM